MVGTTWRKYWEMESEREFGNDMRKIHFYNIPDEHGTLNGQNNLRLVWSTCERLAYSCPRVVI